MNKPKFQINDPVHGQFTGVVSEVKRYERTRKVDDRVVMYYEYVYQVETSTNELPIRVDEKYLVKLDAKEVMLDI